MSKLNSRIKGWFFSGVTFLVPIALTLWLLWLAYYKLALLLKDPFVRFYERMGWVGVVPTHVLVFGAEISFLILTFLLTTIVGFLVTKFLKHRGNNIVHHWLEQVPVVKSVFKPVRQAVQSLLGDGMEGRKVVKFPYPASPYMAIGVVMDQLEEDGESYYLVMMPLTMSAGTGVLLQIPCNEATLMDVDASQALAHVISCGMVKLQVSDM